MDSLPDVSTCTSSPLECAGPWAGAAIPMCVRPLEPRWRRPTYGHKCHVISLCTLERSVVTPLLGKINSAVSHHTATATIIIPVHNRRETTLECLRRLESDHVFGWANVLLID